VSDFAQTYLRWQTIFVVAQLRLRFETPVWFDVSEAEKFVFEAQKWSSSCVHFYLRRLYVVFDRNLPSSPHATGLHLDKDEAAT
jgi:hypothetical protein